MFMLKKLAHLALLIFVQFAVVILHDEQSTSFEIYDLNLLKLFVTKLQLKKNLVGFFSHCNVNYV